MTPRTLTTPLDVRGDVPGLLVRGMPVCWQRPDRYGIPTLTPDGMPGTITGTETRGDSGAPWAYVTWATGDSEWVPVIGLVVDWSSPLAVYACLHWLSDRGHPCLWMLPTAHGGRTATSTQAAILVSVSVGRVVKGGKPVTRIYVPSVPEVQPDGIVLVNGYRFPDMFAALAEIDKNKANALDDGAALLGDDGAVTVGVADGA